MAEAEPVPSETAPLTYSMTLYGMIEAEDGPDGEFAFLVPSPGMVDYILECEGADAYYVMLVDAVLTPRPETIDIGPGLVEDESPP